MKSKDKPGKKAKKEESTQQGGRGEYEPVGQKRRKMPNNYWAADVF